MKTAKKRKIAAEIVLLALTAGILTIVLKHHMPKIIQLLASGNVNAIDDYLQAEGTDGRILLIVLQIIETLSIVLPSMPVYICAGILFGKVWGIVVCYSVNLILNILMFLTGRKMSDWTKEHFDINNNETVMHLMQSAKHMDRIVGAMCLLPIVPNGTIPFLAAQMNINAASFIRAIATGSLPSIVIYVCFGDILLSNGWKIILPIIIILIILGILFLIFRKKIIAYFEPRFKKWIQG